MPEGSSAPEIKISKNPEIQQRVEEKEAAIIKKYPDANPGLVNEQVRSRVANEIRIERLRKYAEIKHKKSITDNLTGALNNTGFEEVMQHEGRRTIRSGKSMVIVVLDANNLKEINKSGHAEGDKYLQKIADVLRKTSRLSDVLGRRSNSNEIQDSQNVARWGGDEFGVILGETDIDGAKIWWERTADEFKRNGISIGAGMQILNPSEISGKTPAEISAIISDKKNEADLAMLGVAKPESKSNNLPTLSVYNELPESIRQTLPQRIKALSKVA